MKLRLVSIILALLMLLCVVVGCSDTTDDPADTTTATQKPSGETTPAEGSTDTTVYVPTFEEADYGNTDFTVYMRNADAASYAGLYIDSDDVTETMSEAVFNRNLAVEEKYKVNIVTLEEGDPYKKVRTYVESGDIPFDVILDRRTYMSSLAQEGNLYNWKNIDHVDFNQPYWDSNCAEGYELAGKLYFMANDTSISNLAGARFFYFNKEFIKQFDLQNPYDLIKNDQWTYDKFLTMVKSVTVDNGDGIYDSQDTYGLCSETGSGNGNIMHMLVGCGVKFLEKTNDGALTTNAYNEITDKIMSDIKDVIVDTPYAITYGNVKKGADTSAYANDYDFGRSLFASGHFLFIQGNMAVSVQFKDMSDDYGVTPNPKYDASQESYYHKLDKYSLIWAVPFGAKTDEFYDRVGVIMEYWAYESSKTVMPAYYETTIKTKRVQEQTASDIIDIVKDTIRYDISDIYNDSICDILYSGYTSGNLSSNWGSSKKALDKTLGKIYEKIEGLE